MRTSNPQLYFKNNFFSERLTSNIKNKELISSFKAPNIGSKLENYLHNDAWNDDLEGETKVYLIKDKDGLLAAFFSLKCGILYDDKEYQKLTGDELELLSLVFKEYIQNSPEKHINIHTYCEYYQQMDYYRKEALVHFAEQKSNDFLELQKTHDGKYTRRVYKTYSAMEIVHFCKNSCYSYDGAYTNEVLVGAGFFWEQIIPKIQEAVNIVGCKYLYLFAADNSDPIKARSLTRYYEYAFKFEEIQNLMVLKPDYDRRCQTMIQEVSEIEFNKSLFWSENE